MLKRTSLSRQTRRAWLVDAAVFLGGILAALSGIYFLYVPSGGYQGGRNPMYGVTVLVSRDTWNALHTWAGIAMIGAVALHLALHWPWVTMMARRMVSALRSGGSRLSRTARWNVALNGLVALSFALTAASGIYFLFAPSGGSGAGHNLTMDMIHTWAGVVLTVATTVHLAIHWRWVKNVTRRMVLSLRPSPRWNEAPAEG